MTEAEVAAHVVASAIRKHGILQAAATILAPALYLPTELDTATAMEAFIEEMRARAVNEAFILSRKIEKSSNL